jgi:hypothetical protein
MVFKILKQEAQAPEFCDYVKKKIDNAAKQGVVYELEDEDRRIDALYKDTNLYTEKKLLSIDRVLVNKNEYLVATYEVAFFSSETGKQVDRYIDYEGKSVDPIVTQDPRTNELKVTPVGSLKYDIPFSAAKVDSLISEYGGEPNEFRFYTSSNSPAKKVTPVEVKRKQFFANASWDELLIGKEKKYTSSTTNKLPTLRKEVAFEEKQVEGEPVNYGNTTPPVSSNIKPLTPSKYDSDDNDLVQTNNTDKVTVNTNDTTTTVESKTSENNDVIINNRNSKKPVNK